MASLLLPFPTLARLPATAGSTTATKALCARRTRLARLDFSSLPPSSFSSSPFTSNYLSCAAAAASLAVAGRRRSGVLAVARAAEGDEAAESPGNDGAADEEEEAGVSEEEEEAAAKPPRKPVLKLGDIMGILHKRAIEASVKERPLPDLRTGDIVEIKLVVPGKRRKVATYKGIVMSKQNAGIHTTIRIRRIMSGVGVEIVFPVHSPKVKEIKVVKHRKVRRAKLYYLRDKLPRLSTFK